MSAKTGNGWVIWLSFGIGLLLSIVPMPEFLQVGRPLWLALLISYWTLYLPHRVGMTNAWLLGLVVDVLNGTLLGQNALVLVLVSFLVQLLQQRLRIFPTWQQSLVLLVVFGLTQLVQLWLYVLAGNRPPPTLLFLLPALVSALLWPWLFAALRSIRLRLRIN
ncbi:rod shape-determining protein MreD [Azomonas macrocytogenes]|uniref:Rod shape-determining protein MreD n=1 Tax=Azomonas macrocytogenes TaxID=69962 RepID=A0A839TAQ4_AZOMA|nr:rod shape-determining protein MreD [Azomonas macrocytogenes]MBB3104703.1 rod shape-determining protein MreD [Azomonas macrocytogenes]